MALKHGTTVFCFHLTKVRLEIFYAPTLGQFYRASHICVPNQLILQIQNLWKKNNFQLSTIPGKKFQTLFKV